MPKVVFLLFFATTLVGCSQVQEEASQTLNKLEPPVVAATTKVAVVPTPTPTSTPTPTPTEPTIIMPTEPPQPLLIQPTIIQVVPAPIQTLSKSAIPKKIVTKSSPKAIQAFITKSSPKPTQTAITKSSPKSTQVFITKSSPKPIQVPITTVSKKISSSEIVANIRKNVGCGEIDEEYQAQVMAMIIAQNNPKATNKLTENQFYQAVKQAIVEDKKQVTNLVKEYHQRHCHSSLSKNSKPLDKKATIDSSNSVNTTKIIIQQSNSASTSSIKTQTNQ